MSDAPRTVLMVSKPVAPPWNDSSKNLVKDLASAGQAYRYRVLTPRGYTLPGERILSEGIYPDRGRYAPPLSQHLPVVRRLLRRDDTHVTHFFFAPNPRASAVARACLALRHRATVQTVCSVPRRFAGAGRLLFGQRVVALSRQTHDALLREGVEAHRLVHIPPGIQIPPAPGADHRARSRQALGLPLHGPVVVYPGDLEFSRAAETVALATRLVQEVAPLFVFACRPKGPASAEAQRRIQAMLAAMGTQGQVRMLGEVDRMLDLLAASDLCVLPAESLYAKMDLPLVLLEALALGVPLVVSDRPPLSELLQDDVGLAVPPQDPGALARAVCRILGDPGRKRALAENARAAAEARYDIRRVSRQHEALYDDLLRHGARGEG